MQSSIYLVTTKQFTHFRIALLIASNNSGFSGLLSTPVLDHLSYCAYKNAVSSLATQQAMQLHLSNGAIYGSQKWKSKCIVFALRIAFIYLWWIYTGLFSTFYLFFVNCEMGQESTKVPSNHSLWGSPSVCKDCGNILLLRN